MRKLWASSRTGVARVLDIIGPTRRAKSRGITSASSGSDSGLFGVSDLKTPEDFEALAQRAITRCDTIRAELSSLPADKVNESTLVLLDRISNEICSVIDVAELVRNVHADSSYRNAAESAFAEMAGYIGQVNKDLTLHSTLLSVRENAMLWGRLSEEQRLLVEDLQREFEADGIHLQDKEKQHVLKLQDKIGALEASFMQHAAQDDDVHFVIGPISEPSIRNWLAANVAATSAKTVTTLGDVAICSSNKRVVAALLPAVDDSSVRRQIWLGATAQPASNAPVLCAMVRHRHELARMLGFSSWAHKTLANSVVGDPAQVMAFLASTAELTRGPAEKEMAKLCDLKRKYGGSDSSRTENTVLQPWDVSYYSEMAKSLKSHTQNSSSRIQTPANAQAELSNYFPLHVGLSAIKELSRELFGLVLTEQGLGESEGWLSASSPSIPMTPHAQAGTLKFFVSATDGSPVGFVYFDMFHRRGKFPGAAHFTVKCGCSAHLRHDLNIMNPSLRPAGVDGPMFASHNQYQLPVVALVFNLQPPGPIGTLPCLSLHDLATIFHEWGHALHSLLSRTTFQHLSGTRAALDFVEVPSHLMEHFARDSSLLCRWGRHNVTGLPPSRELVLAALESRSQFGFLEAQQQLLYALADQFCFSKEGGETALGETNDEIAFANLSSGVALLQREHTVFPPYHLSAASGTVTGARDKKRPKSMFPSMHLLSHSHLVSYGGSYYAYLYAKLVASQLWHLHFQRDPLNPAAGALLSSSLLSHGASSDPRFLLNRTLGGHPLNARHFIENLLLNNN